MRGAGVRWVVVVLVAAVIGLPARAIAQVPPLPQVPEPPAQVTDLENMIVGTAVPAVNQAAVMAGPSVTPAGFALRSPCGVAGGLIVVLAIAGIAVPLPVGLPVGPATALAPALIMCSYAYDAGPADSVFTTVDGAVGPTISDGIDTVVASGGDGIGTIRSTVGPGCLAALVLEPGFTDLPPPANRVDPFHVVC